MNISLSDTILRQHLIYLQSTDMHSSIFSWPCVLECAMCTECKKRPNVEWERDIWHFLPFGRCYVIIVNFSIYFSFTFSLSIILYTFFFVFLPVCNRWKYILLLLASILWVRFYFYCAYFFSLHFTHCTWHRLKFRC